MTNDGRVGVALRAALAALVLAACGREGTTEGVDAPAPTHEVPVAVAGDGRGTVRVAPAGLDCAAGAPACAATLAAGTVASLTATPEAGSTFAGWAGTECGTAPTCAIRGDRARALAATF
ncbi:hypothetical protein PYV61_23935, partial [Roseisolibacter sp. H3M3-2]